MVFKVLLRLKSGSSEARLSYVAYVGKVSTALQLSKAAESWAIILAMLGLQQTRKKIVRKGYPLPSLPPP